jgi:hypothetical protein
MRTISILIFGLFMSMSAIAQVTVEQLDFSLSGPADVLSPLIFKFVVHNDSTESVQLLMIKEIGTAPDEWDISICTDACLPPEQDTAIFNVGALDSDTVSLYYFMSTAGSGVQPLQYRYEGNGAFISSHEVIGEGSVVNSTDELLREEEIEIRIGADGVYIVVPEDAIYRLYDLNGRLVANGRLVSSINKLDYPKEHNALTIIQIEFSDARIRSCRIPLQNFNE